MKSINWKKIITVVLTITLIVSTTSPAFATPINHLTAKQKNEFTNANAVPDYNDTDTESLKTTNDAEEALINVSGTEDIQKRDLFTKVFRLDNGVNEVVVYGAPVHYLENGEFKDIDNSLILEDEGGSQYYKNQSNSYKVKIASKSNDEWNAILTQDKYTLKWKILDIKNNQTGQTRTALTSDQWRQLKPGTKRRDIPNLTSDVEYTDVLDDTDLQYIVTCNTVKENIILKEDTGLSGFKARFHATGLELAKLDDGSFECKDTDTGDLVFIIQSSYMIDSNGDMGSVEVELSQDGDDYVAQYILDTQWLKSAKYPVAVDPSVIIPAKNGSTYNVDDNRICQYSSSNYANSTYIMTGSDSGQSNKKNYSLVRFKNLTVNPFPATYDKIYEAKYYAQMNWQNAAAGNQVIEAHQITAQWTASTVTWATRPTYDSFVESTKIVTATYLADHNWDITRLCREWFRVPANNYGLLLKDQDSTGKIRAYVTVDCLYNTPSYVVYKYDTTPPTEPTTLTTSPNASTAWTANSSLTLSWSGITDSESGVITDPIANGGAPVGDSHRVDSLAKAQYQINGGSWIDIDPANGIASGSVAINIASSGTHTIKVRAMDRVGNVSNTISKSVTYKLDVTNPSTPTITTTPAASSTWTTDTTPVLNWSNSADAHSGMNRLQYKMNAGGTWTDMPSSAAASGTYALPTLTSSGTYTYYVRGVDNVGRTGTETSVLYKLDINSPAAPTGVSTVPVATTTWVNNGTPTLSWSGITDTGGSNLLRAEYLIDSGSWTAIPTGNGIASGSVTINVAEGNHIIKVRGVDNAGNVGATNQVVYKCDLPGPAAPTSVTTNPAASADWVVNTSPTLSWSGISDIHSGVQRAEYQINSGAWTPIPTGNGITSGSIGITISSSGTYTISVRGVDNANNNGATRSVIYKLDTTAPTAPTSLATNPVAVSTWTNNTSPTLTWSGITDAHSGLLRAEYQINDGAWLAIPAGNGIASGSIPLSITAPGIYTIKVRGRDNVNNLGAIAQVIYQLNVATPEEAFGTAEASGVNRLAWIEGQGGRNGTGVTYNIYRGTSAGFTINASNRLNDVDANGMGITPLEYTDDTGTAGTTYYYKVTAIKNIGTALNPLYRESLPSAAVQITCATSDELDKRLGIKSHWGYSGFKAGNGSGSANVSTGNVVFQSDDFSFPSILPMSMGRAYNSQSTSTTPLGKGWDFSFNVKLLALPNGDMALKEGDGTLYRFIYDSGTGAYTPENGLFMSLEYLDTYDLWRITRKDNIKYLFFSDKRLARVFDLNGNYLDYTYNAQRNISAVTSSAGETVTFSYYTDADSGGLWTGLLKSVTDPANRVFNYTYNNARQLISRSFTLSGSEQWTEQFTYHASSGLLNGITDGMGKQTALEYTGGRVTKVTLPIATEYTTYVYDDANKKTTVKNQLDQGTIYEYNVNGLVTKVTDALGHATNYTYSLSNFLMTEKSYHNTINGVNTLITWANEYDANGNLILEIDPLGQRTAYEYNGLNQVTFVRVKNTDNVTDYSVTKYEYDDKGNLTKETDPLNRETTHTYYGNGLLHTTKDHFNKTKTYTYNSHGWLTVTQDPLGKTEKTLAYDAMGNALYTKDTNGNVTRHEYDALGRKTRTYQPLDDVNENDPGTADWENDPYEETEYDLNENITRSVSADGVVTASVYDNLDRLTTKRIDPEGDNKVSTISYGYDGNGNFVETSTNEANVQSRNYYNAIDNLIKTESDGSTINYEYDNAGNQTRSIDNEGRETVTKYDKLNRQTDVYEDPSGKNIHATYSYDRLSRVENQNHGLGTVTVTAYDLADRPTSVTSTKNNISYVSAYTYDEIVTEGSNQYIVNTIAKQFIANGVPQDDGSKTTYTDAAGNLVKEVETLAGGTVFTFLYSTSESITSIKVGTANPRELIKNTFDNTITGSDLLTKVTFGNGDWKQYTYDETGKLKHEKYETDTNNRFNYEYEQDKLSVVKDHNRNVETRYTYDDANRITGVNEGAIGFATPTHTYTVTYTGNNITGVSETINGHAASINYAYDANNKLTDASYGYGAGNTAKVHWDYDDYKRVSSRKVYDDNTTQIFETGTTYTEATYTTAYVQTIRNRRVGQSGYDKTFTYVYDNNDPSKKNYNITKVSDGTVETTYAYDDKQQLIRENNEVAGKTWTWTYDNGGNITEKREYDYTVDSDLSGKTCTTISYTYADSRGWKDMLTSYDGNAITYDDSGNPLSDETWTYTWEAGRNLVGLSKPGTAITYTYNKNGIRTGKTVNGVTTTYVLKSDRVTSETTGSETIFFRYDCNNELISMNLGGTEYYYFRNAQYDIVGLFDRTGEVVVEYSYDAWGNILSVTGSLASTLGAKNPYRYRGYRFDNETGWYYLQSRYFNSLWGKFICSDDVRLVIGNSFEYCNNNPISRVDYYGFYSSANAAAKAFAMKYNADSIRKDKEYGGYIYAVQIHSGRPARTYYDYRYSSPIIGSANSVDIPYRTTYKGGKVVALIHTHGAFSPGYIDNDFSYADKTVAWNTGLNIYLACPIGKLLLFDITKGGKTSTLSTLIWHDKRSIIAIVSAVHPSFSHQCSLCVK